MSLVLYTHPMSPCAQKVRIVLHEKALSFEARHVAELAEKGRSGRHDAGA